MKIMNFALSRLHDEEHFRNRGAVGHIFLPMWLGGGGLAPRPDAPVERQVVCGLDARATKGSGPTHSDRRKANVVKAENGL